MPRPAETPPRYGSAEDLARYSGLSVRTLRRLIAAGELAGRKVGRRTLVAFADFDAYLAGCSTPPSRPGE